MRRVILNDAGMNWTQAELHFQKAADWALDNCPSFCGVEVADVSDFSAFYDLMATYTFNEPEDAMMFKIAWSGGIWCEK